MQSGLNRLIALFPEGELAEEARDEYNRQCAYEFERVRDFIILHYHQNQRDEPFWIDRREMKVPEVLAKKVALFRASGRLHEDAEDLFKNVAWLQVLLGQQVVPETYHPLADRPTDEQLRTFLGGIRQVIAQRADSLMDHRRYIEQHCSRKS